MKYIHVMFSMSTVLTCKRIQWIALLVCSLNGNCQISQTGRFEINLTKEEPDDYTTAGLEQNGLMLYRRHPGKKQDQIELIKIDTALRETWRGFIVVEKRMTIMQVQFHADLFFMLLKDREYLGNDFQIIAVKLATGDFGSYTVKNIIPFFPTEFMITGKAALVGGYFNNRPLVLYYNFTLQQSRILPGFFNSPGELNQIKVYEDGSLDVIVSAKNFEKKRALWIRNYDPQGELAKTTVIQPEQEKNLIFGRSLKLENGEQVVAGVYGRFTEYSRGIFLANVNAMGEYTIQYYNFSQLEHFFNYMKAKQQKRVRERIERKKIKGKKTKFNYRLLVHDLIFYNNQLLLVGEAFYPHYIYPRHQDMQVSYYDPQVRSNMIFDGYQYTHAVAVGFNKSGQLIWDNSFEINDLRTFQLRQFVKIKTEKDRILLMYLFHNVIRTKIIHDNEVLEGKTSDQMKSKFEDEVLDKESTNTDQMDYWYGNYLYAFGTQTLKNKQGSSRKVFFVNKITYR